MIHLIQFQHLLYQMLSLKNKLRDEFNNINLDRSSLTRSPKRFKSVKKKKTFREANNNENNNIKIIKDEEELSLSYEIYVYYFRRI